MSQCGMIYLEKILKKYLTILFNYSSSEFKIKKAFLEKNTQNNLV